MAIINLGKVVPERGVDYWTDEDKEEIINQVETDIDITTVRQAIQTLQIDSAHTLEMSLNQTTYQLTLILKNINGTVLSTQTVNFPNEDAITNIVYNSNKTLTVTKQSGTTSTIDLSPIIAGIEPGAQVNVIETIKVNGNTMTPVDKKVNISVPTKTSDLTNDSGYGTYTKPSGGIPKTDLAEAVQTSLGKADTAIQEHQDISGKEDKTNKVTELSSESTDEQYPSAKAVYDGLEESYTEISKLQDKVAKQKKVIDGLPQVEDTGEEVVLDKTMEAEMIEFDTKGNSKQETTEGKNLFNNDETRAFTTGLNTASKIDTGIRLTGASISDSSTAIVGSCWRLIDLKNYVGKTIRAKTKITINGNQYSMCALGVCNSSASSRTVKSSLVGSDTVASFVVPEFEEGDEKTYLYIIFYLNYTHTGASLQTGDYTDFSDVIITIDNEDMTYEKFTYGASPNLDYEQPVSSCGDNINIFDNANTVWKRNNANTFNEGTLDNNTTRIRTNSFEFEGGKTYIVSGIPTNINLISARGYNSNQELVSSYSATNNIFTLPNEIKYIHLLFGGENFDASTNILMANANIKIEESSVASGYSPYGMGSMTEKKVTKNLLEITENTKITHCSYVSGANTNQYKLLCTQSDMYFNEVKNAGQLYTSANGKLMPCKYGENLYFDVGNSLFTACYFTEYDKNFISLGYHSAGGSNGTYTPTDTNCAFVTFRGGYGRNAEAGTTYILAPIISKTPIISYVSHQEQTRTIPTQQPMHNIKDRLGNIVAEDEFVRKQDGNLYERHNIARYFFNAQSNIYKLNATNNTVFQCTSINSTVKKPSASNIAMPTMSNFFKGIYTANEIFGQNIVGLGVNASGNINIGIGLDKSATTEEEIKAKLISKNAYIDYPLAEPLDLPCTQEQIDILESNPDSFKNQTVIYSEDEIPSNVYAKALYDINDLISRVEILESEN